MIYKATIIVNFP